MAPSSSLKTLREEAAACRACPLWKHATQTVFGDPNVPFAMMSLAKSAPMMRISLTLIEVGSIDD